MSNLEDIKAKIQAGEINEAMAMAIAEAMKLEIVTCVADGEKQASHLYLRTVIDLLSNEIENQFSEQLINNNYYSEIQQIHTQQVHGANDTILENIESLQKMFDALTNTLAKLPA